MWRIMSTVVIVFFCLACGKKESTADIGRPAPFTPPPAPGNYTFLALGDSYTIGQSVEAAERFPAQTVSLLRQQNISVSDPVYIARTGWTTANLQAAIATQAPPSTFDLVTLLIGVNDQYQGQDTTGYAVRFTQLLQNAVQLAKGNRNHVFVLSIPDYSATPFVTPSEKQRVQKEIDWFNDINKRITEMNGVSYTNITPSTREAANNPSLVAGDGLHPSGLEYKKWANLLLPKIKTALQ